MKYYELKGYITLTEPFYINVPNSNKFPTDTNGNPIIPASSIRGWLRFISYRSLLEVFNRKEQKFSIHEQYLLLKGTDTGGLIQSERATTIGSNFNVRKLNPHIDLYGRWGLSGSLGVGNAIAGKGALTKTPNGSRGHIADGFDEIYDFVRNEELELLSTIMGEDGEYSKEVQDLKSRIRELRQQTKSKEITDQIADLEQQINAIKAQKIGSKESVRRVNYGLSVLDAGTRLAHKMKLNSANPQSLQFLIWTISKLRFFNLGGKANYNFGDVRALWKIYEYTFDDVVGRHVGEIGWADDDFVFELNDDLNFDLKAFQDSLTNTAFNFKDFG
ncbi:hypothetical protein [Acinetobacter sp. P1(2025)]|uniref:hypothetical protein n=1 Tax=Acinetobacter sp. P1(2025) TaxID=3446120 RepID=UPI003F52CBDB